MPSYVRAGIRKCARIRTLSRGWRVPSIWDTYCEQPGNIVDHSSGAVACDQYHRYAEDIGLMKQLGVSA